MQAHNEFAAQVETPARSCSAATRCSRPDRDEHPRRVEVTDGPFVETKEALGGYYLVEARRPRRRRSRSPS